MEQAKKKRLTLAELDGLRQQGKKIESSQIIAEKRAARANKKAQIAAKAEQEKVRQAELDETRTLFSTEEKTKKILKNLQVEIREYRKKALAEKNEEFELPESLKRPYILAFEKLTYNHFRKELGALSIEGLKIQDREVKIFTYNFVDNLLANGFIDMGWVISMLNKKYVSRYGWALLRKHADLLANPGGYILGDVLDEWADDPDTWMKWERLAKEDGLPVDTRELYPRIRH